MESLNPKMRDYSFSRKVIVGLQSFLYDILEIPSPEDNNQAKTKKVPFFYSRTGEQQFLQDLFLDHDTRYGELDCKVNGIVNKIPMGIVSLKTISTDNSALISGDTYLVHNVDVENEFGKEVRTMSTRGELKPQRFNFEVKVRCGSDIERLLIFEAIDEEFHKARKFFITWNGFEKLDCLAIFPEDINKEKKYEFKASDNEKHPELSFNIEVFTYKPMLRKGNNNFNFGGDIKTVTTGVTVKDEKNSTDSGTSV